MQLGAFFQAQSLSGINLSQGHCSLKCVLLSSSAWVCQDWSGSWLPGLYLHLWLPSPHPTLHCRVFLFQATSHTTGFPRFRPLPPHFLWPPVLALLFPTSTGPLPNHALGLLSRTHFHNSEFPANICSLDRMRISQEIWTRSPKSEIHCVGDSSLLQPGL